MTLLKQNTTPAERARGCVFSETFHDVGSVARNGGTSVGSPPIDKGATLDGLTQYVQYQPAETFFVGDFISIVIEFYPAFAATADVDSYLFSGDGEYFVRKLNNAGSNVLRIRIGNSTLENISEANYASYWLKDQKNVLVVSATGVDSQAYLNGNEIMDSSSGWNPDPVNNLDIGARSAFTTYFEGRITKFQLYNRKLTAQEAADLYNGTVYDYREQTSLHLPMGAAQHDPINVRTLDVSGNDRHATFGDGSTPSTYSTKIGRRAGYDFDGANEYLRVNSFNGFGSLATTICLEFWPDFAFDFDVNAYLLDADAANRYFILKYNNANANDLLLKLGNNSYLLSSSDYGPYWREKSQNILVVSADASVIDIWLNGAWVKSAAYTYSATSPDFVFLGIRNSLANAYDGQINNVQIWQQKLTPLQIADLTIKAGVKVNDV